MATTSVKLPGANESSHASYSCSVSTHPTSFVSCASAKICFGACKAPAAHIFGVRLPIAFFRVDDYRIVVAAACRRLGVESANILDCRLRERHFLSARFLDDDERRPLVFVGVAAAAFVRLYEILIVNSIGSERNEKRRKNANARRAPLVFLRRSAPQAASFFVPLCLVHFGLQLPSDSFRAFDYERRQQSRRLDWSRSARASRIKL